MKQKFRKSLPALVFLLLTSTTFLFFSRYGYLLHSLIDCTNFFGVPRPPVPSFAEHVQIGGCGSFGDHRTIRFETDKPVNEIQQFYRTELAKRGWSESCGPAQVEQTGCPLGDYTPIADLRDGYEHAHEPMKVWSIDLVIYKPGQQRSYLVNPNNRLVELTEYRYSRISNAQTVPDSSGQHQFPLTPGAYPWPGAPAPTPLPIYPYP